jgi:nitrate reductase NapE component
MFGLWMILIVCIIAAFGFLAATGQLKTGVKGKGGNRGGKGTCHGSGQGKG